MGASSALLTSGPFHYAACALLVGVAAAARRSARARQIALLLASWIFYANWGLGFTGVLLFSSLMNYLLGAALRRRPTTGLLWVGIVANVALLAFFKYGTRL